MKTKTKKHKVEIPEGMKVKRELWPTTNSDQVTIEFEPIKKELPKTWEEHCKMNGYPPSWIVDSGTPKKYQALGKLEILRDVYNDGWVTYKSHDYEKYIIFISNDDICTGCAQPSVSRILSFKIEKLRDEFLYNFRDLIEQAKPLL